MSARAHDIKLRSAHPRKPQLKVVKKPRKPTKKNAEKRGVSGIIVGAVLAGGIVAAILLEQVVLAQSAFHLSDLRNRLEAAEEKHEVLLMEAARLDSPSRIERYARETLGMVDPGPEGVQYIVADIKQPKHLRNSIGGKHTTTLPTEGVAIGDDYEGTP